jgi:hypothetical protein
MTAWTDHSLSFAMQTAFGTPAATGFVSVRAENPKVSFSTEVKELELMTGQVGAAPSRIVKARRCSLETVFVLEGLKEGYDPTAEIPGGAPSGSVEVIPPWLALVANAIGSYQSNISTNADFWRGKGCSTTAGYSANGVASATSTAITVDSSTVSDRHSVGQLIVAATAVDDTTPQIGWLKTKAAQVLTLFEAAVNTDNSASAHMYPTASAFASAAAITPLPLTALWTGQATELGYYLTDLVCESWKLTFDSSDVPTLQMRFRGWGFQADKTAGGLVVPDAYDFVPQLIGTTNATAKIAGTATAGLKSCTLEWSATVRETTAHHAASGVSAITMVKPRFKIGMTVPHDTGDTIYDTAGNSANAGQHKWQSFLELRTQKSLSVYVGSQVGRIWSSIVPAAELVSEVQIVDDEGAVAYQLQWEAVAYAGDATDTAETAANSPLNSLFRTGLG